MTRNADAQRGTARRHRARTQLPAWRCGGESPTRSRTRLRAAGSSPAASFRAKSRSPRPSASTATPCAAPSRRSPSAAWCAPSAAAERSSSSSAFPIRSSSGRGSRKSSAAQAHTVSGRFISSAIEACNAELAKSLKIKAGTAVTRLELLRQADRVPLCASTTWLDAARFPGAAAVYASTNSITRMLTRFGVKNYSRKSTRVTAAIAEATDATLLRVAIGRPLLVVDSVDIDGDGIPDPDIAVAICCRPARTGDRDVSRKLSAKTPTSGRHRHPIVMIAPHHGVRAGGE